MNRALEEVLLRLPEDATSDLAAQLRWLEELILAAEQATELGPEGARAALDLKAALGAIVLYARGSRTEADRLALEMALKTLVARALYTLYGALAATYGELAKEGPLRVECRELARLWGSVQRAVERAQPIPKNVVARLEALRTKIVAAEG